MAASQLVTLGVGTPGDIPNFLLWGLGGAEVAPATGPSQYIAFGIGSPAGIPNYLLFGLGGVDQGDPDVPLDLCCTTTVSLMSIRRTKALNPDRETRSLQTVRRTKRLC